MERNSSLWMIITLLPFFIFALMYVKGSAIIYFLLFIVVSATLFFIKKVNNRYLPLLILVGSFLLYGFYRLGSTESPQSFESLRHTGKVDTFIFNEPQKIDQLCYYVGIDHNANFHMRYLNEQNGWITFYEYKENFPFSFRWRCQDVNITTSQIALYLDKGQFMLGEVHFLNKGQSLPFSSKYPQFHDEPHMAMNTGYFGGMFFDEIYHGRTAFEILHGLKLYENTHPYLGKLLITPGIKFFDMTPFGWRFTNVLAGALLIIVVYSFALRFFREERYAVGMAFLMTYSFMHFTEARGAFIDTFGVLFVILSYLFLYRFFTEQKRRHLVISGIFFGLAGAIKWTALFASIGYIFIAIYLLLTRYPLADRFKGYRLIMYGIWSYVGIAGIVYLMTFWNIAIRGGSFQAVIDYQINMFKYHAALSSVHAYSSPWWSWIFDFRPMCFRRDVVEGISSSITAFGNPALFWMGFLSIVYLIFLLVRRRSTLESALILSAFMGLLLPYALISRSMFIYHFYYAIPFLFAAVMYMWRDLILYSEKFWKIFVFYLMVVSALFLFFYPVLSGYEVPRSYVNDYLVWFNGWWL